MSSSSRGLDPRKGLELVLMKMGRAGPPLEPRRRPQAGKTGDPHSQNADNYTNRSYRVLCCSFVWMKCLIEEVSI